MSQVRDNDQDFIEAMRAIWNEAFEARKAAFAVYSRPNSTEDDKQAFLRAWERQQAMWDAYETVTSVAIGRCDRVLAELRRMQ
jgi:hypothetical protein